MYFIRSWYLNPTAGQYALQIMHSLRRFAPTPIKHSKSLPFLKLCLNLQVTQLYLQTDITVLKPSSFSGNKNERFKYVYIENSGMGDRRRQIKCEGRFHELRELIAEAITAVFLAEDPRYRFIEPADLDSLYNLIEDDIAGKDPTDPYFGSGRDILRGDYAEATGGQNLGLGLLPLINPDTEETKGLKLENILHHHYAMRCGASEETARKLLRFSGDKDYSTEGIERLDVELGIDMGKLYVPNNGHTTSLKGHKLAAGFSVGPNALGTLVYDAPFHVELHMLDPKAHPTAERTANSGVFGIGFWVNPGEEMLLAQIQQMRGGRLPEGMHIGTAGFVIAEAVGKALGLKTITAYSAKQHPQFIMYPDSIGQMLAGFKQDWDTSAHKLGYIPLKRDDGTGNDRIYGYKKGL